jgi:hypothetical protein
MTVSRFRVDPPVKFMTSYKTQEFFYYDLWVYGVPESGWVIIINWLISALKVFNYFLGPKSFPASLYKILVWGGRGACPSNATALDCYHDRDNKKRYTVWKLISLSEKRYQFPVRNTKWLKNGKLCRAILSAFYNISQRNFGILLILWCSFKPW